MIVGCPDCGARLVYTDEVLTVKDQWFFLFYNTWLRYDGQKFGGVKCPRCWGQRTTRSEKEKEN